MTPTRITMRDGGTAYTKADPDHVRQLIKRAGQRGWWRILLPDGHGLEVHRIAAINGQAVQR